jgi:hypothetical protein
MKPLNRPMFRYGGPIKEGIMDGIREPKKNGGAMGINKPKRGLVNEPGSYAGFLLPLAFNALRFAARPFGQFVAKEVAKKGVTGGGGIIRSGLGRSRVMNPGESLTTTKQVFNPNAIGSYFAKSPEAGAVKALISGSGKIAGPLKKVAVGGAKSPLTVGGLLYMGGSYFYPDGTPAAEEDIKKAVASEGGPPGGGETRFGNQKAVYDAPKKGGGVELSAEERRAKRVERYRDIMDIKGMNKKAAYNSLIEASRLINESGDFKGDIKSGRLINQIIGATSKAFDKPAQTKDAIDTLILKGEIEKDIKASDPAAKLAAELTSKKIDLADKQLKGDTLEDTVNAIYAKTGAFPSGSGLAGVARTKGIDVKDVARSEDINKFLEANPGKNEVDFMESIVQANVEKGKSIEPGAYVVKTRIIVIDSEGNVSPYL